MESTVKLLYKDTQSGRTPGAHGPSYMEKYICIYQAAPEMRTPLFHAIGTLQKLP